MRPPRGDSRERRGWGPAGPGGGGPPPPLEGPPDGRRLRRSRSRSDSRSRRGPPGGPPPPGAWEAGNRRGGEGDNGRGPRGGDGYGEGRAPRAHARVCPFLCCFLFLVPYSFPLVRGTSWRYCRLLWLSAAGGRSSQAGMFWTLLYAGGGWGRYREDNWSLLLFPCTAWVVTYPAERVPRVLHPASLLGRSLLRFVFVCPSLICLSLSLCLRVPG